MSDSQEANWIQGRQKGAFGEGGEKGGEKEGKEAKTPILWESFIEKGCMQEEAERITWCE